MPVGVYCYVTYTRYKRRREVFVTNKVFHLVILRFNRPSTTQRRRRIRVLIDLVFVFFNLV